MRSSFGLLAVSPLLASVSAVFYTETDSYDPSNFFDRFTFITDDDPSGGYVE
jgi:hypothetical protein